MIGRVTDASQAGSIKVELVGAVVPTAIAVLFAQATSMVWG